MDISQYDVTKAADAGSIMSLRHPVSNDLLYDKDGKTLDIGLMGTDSTAYRDFMRKRATQNLRKAQRNPTDTDINFEEADRNESELFVEITTSVSDNIDLGASKVTMDHDSLFNMYLSQVWIREQVRKWIGQRANFLKS